VGTRLPGGACARRVALKGIQRYYSSTCGQHWARDCDSVTASLVAGLCSRFTCRYTLLVVAPPADPKS